MTYLLDTHVWLWMLGDADRIRPDLAAELADDVLHVSSVSLLKSGLNHTSHRNRLPRT